MRYRVAAPAITDLYDKVETLSTHIQNINLQLWTPGRDIAVDETMVRFTGRAYEVTTIPNKPTPTGLKVWVVAKDGFALVWQFHRPGKRNGPIEVSVPKLPKGEMINKTQAVIATLLQRLPRAGYHCYMDNLFTSTNLLRYLRGLGIGATGTCRATSGVLKPLVHTGWKDNSFVLAITTVHNAEASISTLRMRPKRTSSSAKTARIPFGNELTKELEMPKLYYEYNHLMGAVDTADQLQGHNGVFGE